jgi:hypothetical protein
VVTDEERAALVRLTKRARVNRAVAFRARIVLACIDTSDTAVARRLRTTKWRSHRGRATSETHLEKSTRVWARTTTARNACSARCRSNEGSDLWDRRGGRSSPTISIVMRSQTVGAVLALCVVVRAAAQDAVPDVLLQRLAAYLEQYEKVISEVVADEMYEQRTTRVGPRKALERDATGIPIDPGIQPSAVETVHRRLQSTVSFMRLPGGAAWLGTREVRSVDKRPLGTSEALVRILTGTMNNPRAQAEALVITSAQHNLGNPRTVNMPMLPLELLDGRHRPRMAFRVTGRDSIQGIQTTRIEFSEKGPPTIIRGESDAHWLIARGVAWVNQTSGAVHRARVFYRDYVATPGAAHAPAAEAEVSVDFGWNGALGMLVPARMREVFFASSGRGEGEAKYSNYRRFATSARLIPQE